MPEAPLDPTQLAALLPGSPGRWPFSGHVRGRHTRAGVTLAWAGRVAASCGPEEAWDAAEALRGALAAAIQSPAGPDARSAHEAVWTQLHLLPPALLAREDLTFFLVSHEAGRLLLSGCGLASLLVETSSGWVTAALAGAPCLCDPGLPTAYPTGGPPPQPPHRLGPRFLGLPPGLPLPPPERVHAACGVHP